ncbi:MAG TPA: hypothetical protein PKM27_08045 [Saprospiraceae bacterium]|nr:hypothetical protein [Saprospiraceae bacterium]HNT21076.1 hypothetical protein [Saprospiraceae bacterium]
MKRLFFVLISFYATESFAQRVMAVQTPAFQRDLLWYSCNFTKLDPALRDSIANTVASAAPGTPRERAREVNELINVVNYSSEAFEGISQKLTKPMQKLRNYKFYFSASRDTSYRSDAKDETQYKKYPLKLYVFGSDGHCGFGELLATPFEIVNHRWDKYVMNLRGTKEWSHIVIYAAHNIQDSAARNRSQSYLMISQHGPVTASGSLSGRRIRGFDPGIFKLETYSTLSFGGIEMMYELSPKAISVFDKNSEIIVSDTLRKDLDHNPTLDTILNKFRGIDYLFLIMNEKKYSKKRLNVISYLKTKYPWILDSYKVMKYSTLTSKRKNRALLKRVYDKKNEIGDLLIVERVQEFVK